MQMVSEFPPEVFNASIPQDGGRVQSITAHPTNRNHVIVANEFGGLWKTKDGGTSWFHVAGLATVFATDVAYAPDGTTVIATLARDNGSANGGGIWRSPDGGDTWAKPATATPPASARTPTRMSGHGISYAPDNPNKVYVGTDYGVAVSGDNGATWSHHMLESVSAISGDRLQNAVRSILALPANRAIALCRTGVYRTDSGGDAWLSIRSGDYSVGFKCVDGSPLDSDKVFILQDYSTLLLYAVGSKGWTVVPLPGGSSRAPFVRISRSSTAGKDAFDIWIGAGVQLLKTSCHNIDDVPLLTPADWSALWRPAGLHDDSGYLGLDGDRRPRLYGSDGGVFKPANDDATKWLLAAPEGSGLNSYQITDLAGTTVRSSPASTYHTSLYFATQDNGIWASADGGTSWPNRDCAEGFLISAPQDAAADSDVTVAYGKVGCGPSLNMFSDANLVNQRGVPNVDMSGTALTFMAEAFFLSPNNWIRYRVAPGLDPEVHISQNNGLKWRWKASVALEKRGTFAVAGVATSPTVYMPFRGLDLPDGSQRIGLVKLTNVFSKTIATYDESDLIYLPDGGSLGLRATMFDWQAVFGVHPSDPDFIIAPDIYNQVVKVSRNGGAKWKTDAKLTNAVTQAGRLLLYDADPYHMQVTRIAFDRSQPDRIVIGTRDAGVIVSDDHGSSWRTISDSTALRYITSFFFNPDDTAVVSTYGRGLWQVDLSVQDSPFDSPVYCKPCMTRNPFDPGVVSDPPDWNHLDVTVFVQGRVNGLIVSGTAVETISVTPGTRWKRYIGDARTYPRLDIRESSDGMGFNGLAGCLAAIQHGEVINGVILRGNDIALILSSGEEFTGMETAPNAGTGGRPAGTDATAPYLIIATNLPMPGVAVLGSDGVVHVAGRGFRFDPGGANAVIVMVDERVLEQNATVDQNGTLTVALSVPDDLSLGQHTVQVIQTVQGQEIAARSVFVKAAIDTGEQP